MYAARQRRAALSIGGRLAMTMARGCVRGCALEAVSEAVTGRREPAASGRPDCGRHRPRWTRGARPAEAAAATTPALMPATIRRVVVLRMRISLHSVPGPVYLGAPCGCLTFPLGRYAGSGLVTILGRAGRGHVLKWTRQNRVRCFCALPTRWPITRRFRALRSVAPVATESPPKVAVTDCAHAVNRPTRLAARAVQPGPEFRLTLS